tara:strand:- start:19140 stop:20546 length:1407 start_codon:yes stop_codon:yes gene_type:complete
MRVSQRQRQLAIVFSVALLPALSSCLARKTYKSPAAPTAELFRTDAAKEAADESLAQVPWTEVFSDSALRTLIAEAVEANLDLQVAAARIESAEANLLQGKGGLWPSLSVQGSGSAARLTETFSAASGFATRQFQLYAAASWEADLWGKLTSAKKAALAQVLASQAYKRAVQTRLVADVAANYYTLLSLDAQLAITEKTIETRHLYEETIELLQKSGGVTGADVEQSRANRLSAQLLLPDLKLQIRQVEHSLSILLARKPGPITRATLSEQTPQALLGTGVPSHLLQNRPDVQQAELAVRVAFEMINVARAYFYPTLTLTANSGLSSNAISDLFNPAAWFSNAAAGLLQPIFNKNINRARLKSSKATQAEALALYKKTLLTAGKEVSDALYSYDMALEKIAMRATQLASLEKAVEYNEELLKFGSASYVDVLTSQQTLLGAQLSQVQDHAQKLRAVVELYRALGGGWR